MVPVVTEVALENQNTFAVARLNIAEGPETARKYQALRAHPTYIVFKDGEVAKDGRIVGQKPKNEFLQKILSAINN